VLGMVSPVVIKLTLRDLAHSGGLVGKVYALSTLGSIVGTFATGFVLVQLAGTRLIVLGVGVVLLLLAAVFGDLLRIGRAVVPLAMGVPPSSSTTVPVAVPNAVLTRIVMAGGWPALVGLTTRLVVVNAGAMLIVEVAVELRWLFSSVATRAITRGVLSELVVLKTRFRKAC